MLPVAAVLGAGLGCGAYISRELRRLNAPQQPMLQPSATGASGGAQGGGAPQHAAAQGHAGGPRFFPPGHPMQGRPMPMPMPPHGVGHGQGRGPAPQHGTAGTSVAAGAAVSGGAAAGAPGGAAAAAAASAPIVQEPDSTAVVASTASAVSQDVVARQSSSSSPVSRVEMLEKELEHLRADFKRMWTVVQMQNSSACGYAVNCAVQGLIFCDAVGDCANYRCDLCAGCRASCTHGYVVVRRRVRLCRSVW